MRLGLLPHSPIALASAPKHKFGAVMAPSVLDRNAVEVTPQLFGNDVNPNCTAVAMANYARGVAALNGYGLVVEDAAPLALYSAVLGNPPDIENTDGAVALDVIAYQMAHGFNIGPQSLVAYHGVVNTDRNSLALGLVRLGGGYWGVTLRERDMENNAVWDVQDGRDDGEVVGGHMINGWDYTGLGDENTVRVGTWGGWKRSTWAWVKARIEEAHGLVWRSLAKTDGTFYSGLTTDGLVAEL